MKFFTMDWWHACQEFRGDDPFPAFARHLASIRKELPAGLLALHETYSLHDAVVREIRYGADTNRLDIHLDGDDGEGGLRQFHLAYEAVASFRSLTAADGGLSGEGGYGSLGYDEPDVAGDGRFEHRLLFSAGIELQVVFGDFRLATVVRSP